MTAPCSLHANLPTCAPSCWLLSSLFSLFLLFLLLPLMQTQDIKEQRKMGGCKRQAPSPALPPRSPQPLLPIARRETPSKTITALKVHALHVFAWPPPPCRRPVQQLHAGEVHLWGQVQVTHLLAAVRRVACVFVCVPNKP